MPYYNELMQEVPAHVVQLAQQRGSRGGAKYVYRDGQYGSKHPVASIGCNRPTRFQSTNYQNYKLVLTEGWVAFCSPSNPKIQSAVPAPVPPAVPEEDVITVEPFTELLPEAPSGALAQVLELLGSEQYDPNDDDSLPIVQVEQAIDRLIQEFIVSPYLHRVESSLHAQLFHMMMSYPELAHPVRVGDFPIETQLVHNEWPESVAREGNRRGNFDFAVLSKRLLQTCPSIKAFRQGNLQAPIVIEIGLDYPAEHLAADVLKLRNSKPKQGYVIHLVRECGRDPDAERIIVESEQKFGIKVAYGCWTSSGETVAKCVNDKQISVKHLPSSGPTV